MRMFIFCLLCFISCKSHKIIDPKLPPNKVEITPEIAGGVTTAVLMPNTHLRLLTDEFDNNFLEIVPGDQVIFKYHFKRNQLPNTVDGHYEEILYVEIPKGPENLFLTDTQLSTVQMTYARLCYCKGTSGFFKVTKGELRLAYQDQTLHVVANFEIDGIPQLIDAIDVSFQW